MNSPRKGCPMGKPFLGLAQLSKISSSITQYLTWNQKWWKTVWCRRHLEQQGSEQNLSSAVPPRPPPQSKEVVHILHGSMFRQVLWRKRTCSPVQREDLFQISPEKKFKVLKKKFFLKLYIDTNSNNQQG